MTRLTRDQRRKVRERMADLFAHGLEDHEVHADIVPGTGNPHPVLGFRVDLSDIVSIVRDYMMGDTEEVQRAR